MVKELKGRILKRSGKPAISVESPCVFVSNSAPVRNMASADSEVMERAGAAPTSASIDSLMP